MKIAVINEVFGCARNGLVVESLTDLGHEVVNVGMSDPSQEPTLTYMSTGLMSALALNLGLADFVVGGCGTGQGYFNSVMQYPGVFCGLLADPLDAWLFTRINDGNCASLAFSKGFGMGGEISMAKLLGELFPPVKEAGYPPHRVESEIESRKTLVRLSATTHRTMEAILPELPSSLTKPAFGFEAFRNLLRTATPSPLSELIMSHFLNTD